MQVLEMEELEGLARGGSGRKKLRPTGSRVNNESGIAKAVTHKNFLTNVVFVAGLAFVLLLYVSNKNSNPKSNAPAPTATSQQQLQATGNPTVAPQPSPAAAGGGGEKVPGEDNQSAVEPSDAGVNAPTPTPPPMSEPTKDNEDDEPFPLNIYSKFATYKPLMNLPLADEVTAKDLAKQWGKWSFWDGDEDERPLEDYMSKYPNKDIPGDDFPDDAWQADAVFVNHYLDAADKLVFRAMEAIYAEYGHPKDNLLPHELAQRNKNVFHWETIDIKDGPPAEFEKKGHRAYAGWTTRRSRDGLVRRLLHAMMTSDTFTVVTGGHSVAAGSGNKFQQSYTMQFHKIMAPIFARLGVKLITRNLAQGGLGTIQHSLGSASLYGDDIDLLLWDAGMTEGRELRDIEAFIRQALIAGKRVPVIWGNEMNFNLLRTYHDHADADIGEFGTSLNGIPQTESAEQATTLPWATRYLNCTEDAQPLCKAKPKFCCYCWVDRDDGIVPNTTQKKMSADNANWHPGWREHQLKGRGIAFGVLRALQEAISIWTAGVSGGPPLDDSYWHVTEYYENIRNKVINMDPSMGHCYKEFEGILPTRFCNTPMKGVTQFTPRNDAANTGITSIAKAAPDGTVLRNKKENLYDGPEMPNPCLQIPEGEIDVYSIITGRRRRLLTQQSPKKSTYQPSYQNATLLPAATRQLETGIVPGTGWEVQREPSGICDGTYDQICNRGDDNDCQLTSYPSERGVVVGNEYSGWLVLNLADLKEGIIMLKFVFKGIEKLGGKDPSDSSKMDDEVNEGRKYNVRRTLRDKYDMNEQPETMRFEYAIDGKITTLTADEFEGRLGRVQRTVWIFTALDDPNFISEAKDVEIAIRMLGCGETCTFGLTHVYWA